LKACVKEEMAEEKYISAIEMSANIWPVAKPLGVIEEIQAMKLLIYANVKYRRNRS